MSEESSTLLIIKLAISDYHKALNNREHGAVAAHHCLDKIQGILNMPWRQAVREFCPECFDGMTSGSFCKNCGRVLRNQNINKVRIG